ncbi:hypothetical protein ACIQGZ_11220 [Streptomyces sp. NPDC092296]|uniref:hypothetical protein n=1 Tax=Streptomyces sp. NPDC092296 TaxID=3366012 RepID=UPI003818252C
MHEVQFGTEGLSEVGGSPERRGRKPWFVAGGVGVCLALGALVVVGRSAQHKAVSPDAGRLVPPSSFQSMELIDSWVARELMVAFAQAWRERPGVLSRAVPSAAAYVDGSGRGLIFIGAAGLSGPVASNDQVLEDFMGEDGGRLDEAKAYDPGALGGSLTCGNAVNLATSPGACFWSDEHTAAMLIDISGTMGRDRLAADARAFRAAAEADR